MNYRMCPKTTFIVLAAPVAPAVPARRYRWCARKSAIFCATSNVCLNAASSASSSKDSSRPVHRSEQMDLRHPVNAARNNNEASRAGSVRRDATYAPGVEKRVAARAMLPGLLATAAKTVSAIPATSVAATRSRATTQIARCRPCWAGTADRLFLKGGSNEYICRQLVTGSHRNGSGGVVQAIRPGEINRGQAGPIFRRDQGLWLCRNAG